MRFLKVGFFINMSLMIETVLKILAAWVLLSFPLAFSLGGMISLNKEKTRRLYGGDSSPEDS